MAIKPLTLFISPVPIVAMPAQTCETQPRPKGEMRASVGVASYTHTPTNHDETEPGGRIYFFQDEVGRNLEEDILSRFE